MMQGTLIFDFDSTLVSCESLEIILESQLQHTPEKLNELHHLTHLGMEGQLSFHESLSKRLAIAAPTKHELEQFGHLGWNQLSKGTENLISWASEFFDIWIISGGIKEAILPFAHRLKINKKNVHAVTLLFDKDGKFSGLDETNPFLQGKVLGARLLKERFLQPTIVVGDGFTDYQLYNEQIATHFIAYTEHARRGFLNDINVTEANNMNELKDLLGKIHATYK